MPKSNKCTSASSRVVENLRMQLKCDKIIWGPPGRVKLQVKLHKKKCLICADEVFTINPGHTPYFVADVGKIKSKVFKVKPVKTPKVNTDK